MKASHTVIVNIEVLTDQLPQQPVRFGDLLIQNQPFGLLDRTQRPLGVQRHPARASAPARP